MAESLIPLLDIIAGDLLGLYQAVATDPNPMYLGRIIGSQHRFVEENNGVHVVRFIDRNSFCNPPHRNEAFFKGIDNPLQIGFVDKVSIIEEEERYQLHLIGNPIGVGLRIIRGEVWVECVGGDSYRRITDIIGGNERQIDLTDNKIKPFVAALNAINRCFTPEEINQDGGIIKALFNQAVKSFSPRD